MDIDANDASLISSGSYTVLGREKPQLLEILKEFSVSGYTVKLLGLFWNPDLNCSLRHGVYRYNNDFVHDDHWHNAV